MFWSNKNKVSGRPSQADLRSPLALPLEPRMMFDGAVAATVADTAASQPADTADAQDTAAPDSASHDGLAATPPGGTADQRQEVVFVDNGVKDYQQLVASLKPGTEVVVLDAGKDGLQQIADYLDGRSGIDAIHIVSHGSEGQVLLGTSVLDMGSVQQRAGDLAAIGDSLKADGDILIYGCDVAKGSGQTLIQQVASLTAADVAASSDATGALSKGGDWNLEAQVGSLDIASLWQNAAPGYDNLLATVSLNSAWLANAGDDWNYSESEPSGDMDSFDGNSIYLDVDSSAFDTSPPVQFTISSASNTPFNLDTLTIRPADANDFQFEILPNGLEAGKYTSVFVSDQQGESIVLTPNLAGITSFTIRFVDFGFPPPAGVFQGSPANMDFLSFTTSPANAAPTIDNLGGNVSNWAGVGNTAVLDNGSDALLADAELEALNGGLGNWAGASLTVQRPGTAVSTDIFGFNTSGALFTVSGNNLQAGGNTFATFTSTGGVLTVTFTSSGTAATNALVNDVARHVTYRSDTPAGDATVRFTLNDGTSSATANVTVTSDTIYITKTLDTATIDASDGVSISEAVAIAAADATGSQTLIFSSDFNSAVSLAGSLAINESMTLNADSASGMNINGGATITLGGGTTLNFTNSTGTATIAATLGGSGALSKAGNGTLILSSVSNEANMSGGITVTAGTLQVGSDDHLSSGTLTLNGGTFTNGAAAMTIDNNIVLGASGGIFTIGGGGGATAIVLSGVVSGSGTLTKNGQAIMELSGNNTYTGSTVVSTGTVIASHANALGTTAGSTTVAAGATVRLGGALTTAESFSISGSGKTVSAVNYGALHLVSGSTTVSGTVTLTGAADISAASGSTLTISGAMSGAFALNKTDSGTLVLSNSGNEAGLTAGTTITAGTLSIANDDYLSSGTITLNGGTLAISNATTIDNAIALASASTISSGASATLSGVLSGSGSLTKTGASTLTLSGSNTHSGAVNLTAGGLALSGGSALGNGSAVTQSASTTLTVSDAETIGSLAGTGSVVLNATLTAGGDNTSTTYSGVISGTSGLTKAGSGTLTLTGNNTYTGATNLSAGGLTLNRAGGALDDNTSVTVASGATLTVSANETIDALSGAGTVALGTSALTIGINGTSSTFSGAVTGSGTLTLDGGGTFTLSGTNSGQGWGLQVLSGGTVSIAGDANLGSGTVQLNDGTLSVTSAGTVDNAITLGASAGSVSVGSGLAVSLSGAIGGAGALTKTGSGTLTLSGGNNYSGTTTVSAGTLSVNGSTASATTVANGATLAGTGTLGGHVTVQSGGTLSPGNSAGTLTVNGNLQMNAGSTLAVEINGTAAGSQYDQLVVNGSVNVSGATLAVTHGYVPGNGDSYILIDNDAADSVTGTFSGLAEGGTTTAGGNGTVLTASYIGGTGNDFSLTAPINDAPVVGNLNGDSLGFIEGGSAAPLDSGSNATVTDSDSADFDGGNVTVAIVANRASGEDILAIVNQGTGAGQIGVSGANITFGGVVIGTFSGGTGTNDLVISLNANATPAAVQALVRNITYRNDNTLDPSTATRTVRITVNDGDGGTSGNADISVSVTGVNDAPTLTATDGTPTYTENGAAVDLFSGVGIGTIEAGQSITGLTLTVGNLANGASEILRIDGTDISLVNGASGTTGGNGIGYSVSLAGGTATITLTHAGLGTASAQTVIDGMSYRNSSEAPTGSSRVVTLTSIRDSGGTSNGGVDSTSVSIAATVAIDAVNDAPTITAPGSIAATEDVTTALTGISFADVDAGGSSLTATFSVASGTLAATSGSGVTVGGSGTGTLTLTGSLANINAFIAASGLSFTTASNATANVTLTVAIDDGGNTGSGGAQTDSTTVTLAVSAVNDAPVNSAPATATVDQDDTLVFSGGNGNLISISDVDAGSGTVEVTLTASNGLITLNGTTGLIFSTGDGAADSVMTFQGSLADINAALGGLTFAPTGGYNGPASLQISTSDLGLSGSGGTQTDTDTIDITVSPINPEVTDVSATTPDGDYKVGDVITITVTFDQGVTVDTTGGVPTLLLETGLVDRNATYVSGSGSNTLTFSYTVQAGDVSADLDFQSTGALALNGATIRSAGSDDAILTLPTVGGANSIAGAHDILIDGVAPSVTSVSVPANGTYVAGQNLDFTVNLSEAVTVDTTGGTPRIAITLDGGGTVFAQYLSGSGSSALVFRLTVTSGQLDSNGISVGSAIQANGGTLRDAVGNNAVTTLNGVDSTSGVRVDAVLPTASIVVADTALAAGETSLVTITFNEAVSGLTTADFTVANGVLSGLSSTDGGITWTATLTPTASITDTSNLISLDNTGVTDLAGNAGTGSTDSNNYAIDTVRPTASIVVADSALAAGETSLVTITFSEAVTGLTTADFSVANGVLSGLSSADGGITWTATLTPTAAVTDASNLVSLDNTGVADQAGNAGTGTTDSNNYAIDTLRPTASIVVADSALAVGETSLVTITFNEAVTGLTIADFSVANGVLSGLSSTDGGITWTATLTPTASITDTSNLISLDNTGVTDQAGNSGTGTTDSNNYVIDTLRPTASIVVADSALAVGETSLVTITFNEAVTGLTTADFSVANGVLSGLSSADGGITWTATLTPTASITDTSNLISLDNTGVTDLAGNTGTGSTDSNNYAIDTVRPTASIVVADSALAVGETSLVTITFNEAVTGLTIADFSVANGVLSGLSSADGGITWTATLTPTAAVTDPSNLISLDNTGVTDQAGNAGTGSTDSNNYAIDTVRPTATIVVADTSLSIGETSTVTITFSEAVTGLTIADFSVANGVLSGLSSADGGITWTATLTPTASITDTSNLISLDNASVTDLAGNAGTGSTDSNNYAIDTVRPTASIVVADNALAAGETSLVTITFSEAVTGLTTAEFSVANGVLSGLSSADGGITWTATLTPTAGITDTANLISLDNTGVTDLAGNSGAGSTDSNNYAIDTLRPSASIVVADSALAVGETSLVTITFNEAVTGLTTADFSVANGVLSGLSSADGGITWTATLTPTAGISDTANLISLDNTGVTDQAGNSGTGSTDSNNYAIDTVRPTATIVVADTSLSIGETSTVTITFSEAVTGLTITDFSVANGVLSGLSSADGGITWTATLTPTASITDTANLISLDNAGVTDQAGNSGTGTAVSNNYAIDTVRPTATIVVADTSLTIGETSTVTITFSEAVTGLTTADFSVANGVLSGLSSANGGITWTATLTPTASITDTANLISLDNTGVTDLAGNSGTGSTDSNNYVIDGVAPSVISVNVPANGTYVAGQHLDFTVNLNEAVTVDTTGGSPRIAITLDGGGTVFAEYLGGSGTSALVFRLTVASGQLDSNGISVGNAIQANGATLRDAMGNNANPALNGVGSTTGVRVDAVVPTVGSVGVPVGVHYNEGDVLTFVVNASERVIVNGTPRLALDIGGTIVFADYVAGSGTTTLVFQYRVQAGDNDADGIAVTGLAANGATLRDAAGNAMSLALNNVGDTHEVIVDTTAPGAIELVRADASPTGANSVRYTLTFSEDVSGLELSDFSLNTTGNVTGTLQSLVQVDGRTFEVVVTNVGGTGTLGISLNATGTVVTDAAGNVLVGGLPGQLYTLFQDGGDPEFRANPPVILPPEPTVPVDTVQPSPPPPPFTSPLIPPPLFEVPTLGSGIPTVGNIFINNGALAPSFIAQVFGSSDSGGDGSGVGFLGFGGGDGGVFGSSSLSSFFSKEVPQGEGEMKLFDAKQWRGSGEAGQGQQGGFGAPTLGQQLQDIKDNERRQLRELAWALGQLGSDQPQA